MNHLRQTLTRWFYGYGSIKSSDPVNSALYPHLSSLMGAYFHQDFDIAGPGFQDVVRAYCQEASIDERRRTIEDINRFIADHGQDDDTLSSSFLNIFNPEVIVEGWDGLTTRQWLQEVARLLAQ